MKSEFDTKCLLWTERNWNEREPTAIACLLDILEGAGNAVLKGTVQQASYLIRAHEEPANALIIRWEKKATVLYHRLTVVCGEDQETFCSGYHWILEKLKNIWRYSWRRQNLHVRTEPALKFGDRFGWQMHGNEWNEWSTEIRTICEDRSYKEYGRSG